MNALDFRCPVGSLRAQVLRIGSKHKSLPKRLLGRRVLDAFLSNGRIVGKLCSAVEGKYPPTFTHAPADSRALMRVRLVGIAALES